MDRTIGYYRCPGKLRITSPVNRCANKNWRADKIETLVWEKIETVLDNPCFIVTAIEKQRDDANNIDTLEPELQLVEKQLRALDREQKQLLQWALKEAFLRTRLLLRISVLTRAGVAYSYGKQRLKLRYRQAVKPPSVCLS